MKLFSGLLGLILVVLALCFALANRQDVTLSLWPFGISLEAPLYLFSLGTLVTGLILGAIAAWFAMLSHRLEARRLRKDMAHMQQKMVDLQQTLLAPQSTGMKLPSAKKAFWRFKL